MLREQHGTRIVLHRSLDELKGKHACTAAQCSTAIQALQTVQTQSTYLRLQFLSCSTSQQPIGLSTGQVESYTQPI